MRSFYCKKCGSPNHKELDCSLPDGTVWTPPPSELEQFQKEEAEQQAAVAVKQNEPKLDPPRWPNGPLICTKENLLAFKDEGVLAKFREANAPGHGIKRKPWLCDFCGHWHFVGQPSGPSGGSSGTQREDNLPKNFKPFIRKSTLEMTSRREYRDELPQQEIKPSTDPKKQAPAEPKQPRVPVKQIKTTDDGQGGLF